MPGFEPVAGDPALAFGPDDAGVGEGAQNAGPPPRSRRGARAGGAEAPSPNAPSGGRVGRPAVARRLGVFARACYATGMRKSAVGARPARRGARRDAPPEAAPATHPDTPPAHAAADERPPAAPAPIGAPDGVPAAETRAAGEARGTRAPEPPPQSAADLVTALWRVAPPEVWALGWRAAEDGVHGALARVAADAEQLAERAAAPGERGAARLLAETARAVHSALRDPSAAPVTGPLPTAGGGLASPVRLRLARMERWLAARAATEPEAAPSADLCLWVVEHLEAVAP